jgi:tyrosine-protein kinase Etk/Wzc
MTQEPIGMDTSKKDPHIMDYLILWATYRKQVAIIVLVSSAMFLGITFMMPFTYSSLATLMPPEKDKTGGLMSFLSGSGALDLMKGQENPALDVYQNVMESRVLSESIARDPMVNAYFKTFDTAFDAIAFHALSSTKSEPLRNGIMNVQVDIKTHWFPSSEEKEAARKLAPHLANLYVKELDKYNRERLMTSARYLREFTEREYGKRMMQLDTAYMNLQKFQEDNKAVSLTDQLEATVTNAALLGSQVQQYEMMLGVEERELTPNSSRVSMLRAQLEEAKHQLSKFDDGSVGEYAIALTKAPELTRKLAKLMREVKLLETISAFLRQQLEQDKLNEQKSVPTFNVLDSAVIPLRKSSPKRSVMLLLGIAAGIVLSGIYISVRSFQDSVRKHPEDHLRLARFRQVLRRNRD